MCSSCPEFTGEGLIPVESIPDSGYLIFAVQDEPEPETLRMLPIEVVPVSEDFEVFGDWAPSW